MTLSCLLTVLLTSIVFQWECELNPIIPSTQEAKTGGTWVWDKPSYTVKPCLKGKQVSQQGKTKTKKNYFFRGVEYYNFILMWSSLSLCCLWFTHLLEFLSLCLWPNRRPINHYVSPWLRGVNVSHYHSLCGLSFSPWEEGQECNPESQPGLVIVPQRGQVL